MHARSDLNARIALAKGWRYVVHDVQKGIVVCPVHPELPPEHPGLAVWYDSQNRLSELCDFVGTLEGVAGLLSELQRGQCWVWIVNPEGGTGTQYTKENPASCFRIDSSAPLHGPRFDSPRDHPGDCVGAAWMSVYELEAVDGS